MNLTHSQSGVAGRDPNSTFARSSILHTRLEQISGLPHCRWGALHPSCHWGRLRGTEPVVGKSEDPLQGSDVLLRLCRTHRELAAPFPVLRFKSLEHRPHAPFSHWRPSLSSGQKQEPAARPEPRVTRSSLTVRAYS